VFEKIIKNWNFSIQQINKLRSTLFPLFIHIGIEGGTRMKLRVVVIVLSFLLIIFQPQLTYGATNSNSNMNTLEILNDLSMEALQFTTIKRYDDAEKVLVHMKTILSDSTSYPLTLSYDDIRVLEIYLNDALKMFSLEDVAEEQLHNSLLTFRLVVDAISSNHSPMWIAMEDKLMSSYRMFKEAIITQGSNYKESLEAFLNIYDMLYPSIMVDVSLDKVQKVDVQIKYIRDHQNEFVNSQSAIEAIEALQRDLENLFSESESDEADPSLWWVIITTGGIIILTLAYVGFRKYRGEKQRKQKLENEHKN